MPFNLNFSLEFQEKVINQWVSQAKLMIQNQNLMHLLRSVRSAIKNPKPTHHITKVAYAEVNNALFQKEYFPQGGKLQKMEGRQLRWNSGK